MFANRTRAKPSRGHKKLTRKARLSCVMNAASPRALDRPCAQAYKGSPSKNVIHHPGPASDLLRAWGEGDTQARDDLLPLVYGELRAQAARYMARERRDHTLQPTALVHEAYLRLVGQTRVSWQNRANFFGVAAQMMRRILVDHARKHSAAKRDGVLVHVESEEGVGATPAMACELVLLDQALAELSARDERQARVVELRYFGGLTEQETAEVLAVSRATVTRDWNVARAWLYRRMTAGIGGVADD